MLQITAQQMFLSLGYYQIRTPVNNEGFKSAVLNCNEKQTVKQWRRLWAQNNDRNKSN